ncbi:protein kinase, partial [bacterium]|nr:protein kinase [bacterium]
MVDGSFWDKLAELYSKLPGDEGAFAEEQRTLRDIVHQFEVDQSQRYEIVEPFALGGAGVIAKVRDLVLGVPGALKLPRPIMGKHQTMAGIMAGEIERLCEISHPNIVRVYCHGQIQVKGTDWSYYVMEYIDGAMDAHRYFESTERTAGDMISVISQCVEALCHLHAHEVVHIDVKLENLLVSTDGRVLLSDLGSARRIKNEADPTKLTFTRSYAHPDLFKACAGSTRDENHEQADVPRQSIRAEYDLYALGKNIFRLLRRFDQADISRLPNYVRAYLELMAARLLDGLNAEDECALHLPRSAFGEIRYISAEQVLQDIKKLTGEYHIETAVPELDSHHDRTIQICYQRGPCSF